MDTNSTTPRSVGGPNGTLTLYFQFTLGLREVEERVADREIGVSYQTIRYWIAPPHLVGVELHVAPRIIGRLRGTQMLKRDVARQRKRRSAAAPNKTPDFAQLFHSMPGQYMILDRFRAATLINAASTVRQPPSRKMARA